MKLQRAKAKQSEHSHRSRKFETQSFVFVGFEVCNVGKRKCETLANGQTFISLWRFTLAPCSNHQLTKNNYTYNWHTHIPLKMPYLCAPHSEAPHACRKRTPNSRLHTIFVLIKFELLPAINVAEYIHSNPVQINIYLSTFYDLLCRCAVPFSWCRRQSWLLPFHSLDLTLTIVVVIVI